MNGCDEFNPGTPRHCLSCDAHAGPVCGFGLGNDDPKFGTTFANVCDYAAAQNAHPYALSGECPPECDVDVDCPQAQAQCIGGSCVVPGD